MAKKGVQIAVRLEDALAKEIDSYVERLKERDRLDWTRADAVRALVRRGLEAVAAEEKAQPKRRG